ncbi:MAG: carbamoyltransferase HypF [Deltaproteobacteria bacterium]|nr:carbamoyltransferase HypF [Deltaproteobacteria bacterium]
MAASYRIRITGVVQGVGMRPFIHNLATRHGLTGWCLNDSQGVSMEVQGAGAEDFIKALKAAPPPLARIESFDIQTIIAPPYKDFVIRESVVLDNGSNNAFALISPDIATCPDCLAEVFDPANRRSLYPFTNCTNCGPRYSIIKDIPYDRPLTTMAAFALCAECAAEYHNPTDRRFHAQPNACNVCGPQVWLADAGGRRHDDAGVNFEAVIKAQALLKQGAIIGIKGLGGFHLACDAADTRAVSRLRSLKRCAYKGTANAPVSNKPFAVMVKDLDACRGFALVTDDERSALIDRRRPIVLLEKALNPPHPPRPAPLGAGTPKGGSVLAVEVAPNNPRYGVMLPYTPLHHLLFHGAGAGFDALVMTSGNLSEEPIVISNAVAVEKLGHIADAFLLHDRDIHTRVDDSIVRVDGEKTRVVRRSRSFAPNPIDLGAEAPQIYATGGLLKNTLCITRGRYAVLSQHIGDLENLEALRFHEESLVKLKTAFKAEPVIVAHDMHPDYMSTGLGRAYAAEHRLEAVAVQHHHAHIVSCMAEHGIDSEVIGVAFDGTGFGTDGCVWGGEFMLATRRGFKRMAHLDYVPMPGADRAVLEPWRMAIAYLYKAYGAAWADLGVAARFDKPGSDMTIDAIIRMMDTQTNSPLTSSGGRLFDAVASLIGLRDVISYEAQAAIELEATAGSGPQNGAAPYPFGLSAAADPIVIDTTPVIRAIVDALGAGEPVRLIAWRFHLTMAEIISVVANRLRQESGLHDVVLSGGVFQNVLLLRLSCERLGKDGFKVWAHERVPTNDGGISLGQAVVAWERSKA